MVSKKQGGIHTVVLGSIFTGHVVQKKNLSSFHGALSRETQHLGKKRFKGTDPVKAFARPEVENGGKTPDIVVGESVNV